MGSQTALVVAVVVSVATIAAILASGGNPIAAIAPSLVVTLAFAVVRLPLRWTATTFVFLVLSLEISTDAEGIWKSPLAHVGDLLGYGFSSLSKTPLAGFEVISFALFAVAAWRHAQGATIDGTGAVPTAGVMRSGVLLVLLGVAWSTALGVANGYGLAMWKARYLLHCVLFFALFQSCFQRLEDFRILGVAVVGAAHVKALTAAWVQLVAAPGLTGGRVACATNHGDSILFAVAVLTLVVPALERWNSRAILRAAIFLPLPLWGMILNNRRLVWAILAMAMAVIFLATSWRPWKSRVVKIALVCAPILIGYVGVGWRNAGSSGIFTPVAKIRTMLDAKIDPSTLWREREAFSLASTLRDRPFIGIGLGGEYEEYVFNDDISLIYPDFKGWPHNTVLGLMLLAGIPGFVALWLPTLIALFLAMRSELLARDPYERIGATIAIGATVACLAIAWGDTGAHFLQYKMAAGFSMAFASKAAVATGAWPGGRIARRGWPWGDRA